MTINSTQAINPALDKRIPFNHGKDFDPIQPVTKVARPIEYRRSVTRVALAGLGERPCAANLPSASCSTTLGAAEQNPDTPYLSAEVLRTDFEPVNLRLGAGIHLHWTLPAVYRRGFQDRGRSGALWHAPALNRWLISRREDSAPPQQWVVESDYLSHPDVRHYNDGVTVPLDTSDGQPSFARLGRCISLADGWPTRPPMTDCLD